MRSTLALVALQLLAASALASEPSLSPVPRSPSVVIVATGGTIAGTGATTTTTVGYTAATIGVESLIAAVPELRKVARVRGEQVFQIASENMTPAHWLRLAGRVNELLARADVDGVVVTHGTDTLEETAYFLDLVVKSGKPVVLVGAMRPATALSADGPMNLFNAVAVAAAPDSAGRGVLVCLNDRIDAARDVTKTDTAALDTFRSPALGVLGVVEGGRPAFYRAATRLHTTATEFDVSRVDELPKVGIVLAYAGSGRVGIDAMVAAGVRGLVHAGTGNGSLSTEAKAALVEARAKGVVVVRASRIPGGSVARNGEADDDALDFVVADDLSPQKARVLLTLALTRTADTREIQRMFRRY